MKRIIGNFIKLGLVLSLLVTLTGCAEWPEFSKRIENPYPGDAAASARGKTIYLANGCVSCHGDTGQGNGPASAGLRVRLPDFTSRARMITRSDPDLFWAIDRGRDRTGMPTYGDKLSDNEMWDLVNYVRSLY
ncbi:MAG: c-type cytochrome [Chloroflexi bacterium]|nr:c-type cytochrome [Chloroflexota bacterium]